MYPAPLYNNNKAYDIDWEIYANLFELIILVFQSVFPGLNWSNGEITENIISNKDRHLIKENSINW